MLQTASVSGPSHHIDEEQASCENYAVAAHHSQDFRVYSLMYKKKVEWRVLENELSRKLEEGK
jgi:hypothetical protein